MCILETKKNKTKENETKMEDSAEMRDFIEFYKSLPELWNSKNESYKNKNTRSKSYNKLLTEYRKIKNDGTLEELEKKIANMRTSYRRELQKVVKSQKSGSGADDIYVSNLWYYEAFDFLRDLEMPLPGRSNLSSDEDEQNVSINMGKTQVNKKPSVANARMHFLKKAAEHLESSAKRPKVEDEAAVYGNGWACMYRQMSPNQQLFAKRAIDEILMLGRLNQLTYNTVHSSFNGSAISTSSSSRSSSTPVVFSDDSLQYIQTGRSAINTPPISRGSSTPVVFSDDSVQYIQTGRSAINTPPISRGSSTPVVFSDDSVQYIQTERSANSRSSISRGSSTPVVFSDEPVQYIQTGVLPSGTQTYANVASGPRTENGAQSYAELFNDYQYQ